MQKSQNQYYGLNGLDKKLESYLCYNSGYFVELGANNGIDQSNTLYFEKCRGWRGVLIEPVLHNYFACKKFRSPENRYFCNACVPFGYKEDFVPILYSNLMSVATNIASGIDDSVEHAFAGVRFLSAMEEPVLFGAKASTLNQLLLEADAPKIIDLLSLDVEGAEYAVLQGIDFATFRFKYICVECRERKKIVLYLHERGYQYVAALSDLDFLFSSAA